MLPEILGVILIGVLAEMNRTSFIYGIFSEPIILCPIIASIFGNPMLGLKLGAILQLYFLGSASMGGSSPPDAALASIVVTVSASIGAFIAKAPAPVAMPVAVILSMAPAGAIGAFIDSRIKEYNVKILHKTEEKVETLGSKAIESAIHHCLIRNFIIYLLVIPASCIIAVGIIALFLSVMQETWWKPVEVMGNSLLPAAAGIALASLREKKAVLVYVGAVSMVLAVAMGIQWLL